MIGKIIFAITHIHTIIKFLIVNWRFKKYGYRKYMFTLYEERTKENGGGFLKANNIIIKGYQSLNNSPYTNAFFRLRDEHEAIFIKNDHLTWKEII